MSTPYEPEFQQAYKEIVGSIESSKLFEVHPELKRVLPIISIPERVLEFRVTWEDDKGNCRVNTGYRVQFNSALGPYKGGLRFHPSVNLSILKFLGFEQIFKNALTGLPMGGGKGGSDFDPKGKSDNEIRRFSQAFMRQLFRYIGPQTDVPAGDIGVTGFVVMHMFGEYKRLRNEYSGVVTGKHMLTGGSNIRPEATGYGVVYYVKHMIEHRTKGAETLKGKRVAISGSGNVAQYAALKCIQEGAIVKSISDSKGVLIAKTAEGLVPEEIHEIMALKEKRASIADSASLCKKHHYIAGARPWTNVGEIDIALPCATQNEVSGEEAAALIKQGCRYVAEGSNMGSSAEAVEVFEKSRASGEGCWLAPGKAANAGGVAVSGLEMAQNAQFSTWTHAEVDAKLAGIMQNIFEQSTDVASKYCDSGSNNIPSLVDGANIAGFLKVATAMQAVGDWW
ncbi:NADP-specific glutamate dehydrogenase [Schizosaccharomyces pombe]|uniref:NADP-specific glutamate dehydrogenase n=1 Tax=Schizosaccharomyces pombe (strain 972 / ATCC 24843) TaxID=284812 RepID=DHE4_SCHPO|nr:putative NADP-specific glutamate dehydrogenase Gdh1 [Schizosaccharomyces pombe]P78804.2 RecName: Full=NADP-specific glutamate dehydrogenase; Short=NADP-GDH; AltName: Full=NADP-dependent glutamate dehydrogenase [Schizosaccharomyces pombe 972h-]CAA21868.1 NADP-specific glutamate dehydrogenase Gdh1 (predicted) [Schizosaccharomyces pombe]|eukprot:NP_588184.1 putative NADP-specific glutamate dehydrogenase Gdh1 [Schizosaccharomyces pombe]